jgi:hypothetical protein
MKKTIIIFILTIFLLNIEAKAENIFRQTFIELSTIDGFLDKNDLRILKRLSLSSYISDSDFAKETISNLSKYKTRTKLEYTIFDEEFDEERVLNFTITSTYSERDVIAGKSDIEIISNISQRDNLNETISDGDRCAAASVLNSYILMGGKFADLAKKYNVDTRLTYKNVHLLQEKIYNAGNSDKSPGIYSGFKYIYYETGEISNIRPSGEIIDLVKISGIKIKPILGNNLNSINSRKKQVENFFKMYPKSTIQVGVYLDLGNGSISNPLSLEQQNHVITIFKRNGIFYYSDTGNIDNGDGRNVKKMTSSEVYNLLYETSGIVMGLYL